MRNDDLVRCIEELTSLLKRIRAWDMLNPPKVADGEYWCNEIDKVLADTKTLNGIQDDNGAQDTRNCEVCNNG